MKKRRGKMEEVIKKRLFHCLRAGREREKRKVRFDFDSELWFWWKVAGRGGTSHSGRPGAMLWFGVKKGVKFSGLAEAGL